MANRRRPRACELVLATDTGESIRFTGRVAEVVAAFAFQVAARTWLDGLDVWNAQVNVTQRRIVVNFTETPEPILFRDRADEQEAG